MGTLLKVEISAATADELKNTMLALAGVVAIGAMSSDAILEHLRDRYRPQGMVVKVDPIDPDANAPATLEMPAPKTTRRTKKDDKPAAPAQLAPPVAVANIKDAPSIAMSQDAAETTKDPIPGPTRADVIAALD